MGCFSFLCKKSGKAVLSTSFSGDRVHLFLLQRGKVIERMFGDYNSYGRVFADFKVQGEASLTEFSSFKWRMDWRDVCDLMFSPNEANGIAAILAPYWKEGDPFPTTRSLSDPNQGWGDDLELLGDVGDSLKSANWGKPFHKVYTKDIAELPDKETERLRACLRDAILNKDKEVIKEITDKLFPDEQEV